MKAVVLLNLLISLYSVFCRDFYMGMFRRNDYLVAQDNLYKEKKLYASVHAEYGRLFKCPISYFRAVDRLGVGSGPTVKVLRGGLRKKYIAVRIKSGYNLPISVNIYVGCENRQPRKPIIPWKATTPASDAANDIAGEGRASSTPGEGGKEEGGNGGGGGEGGGGGKGGGGGEGGGGGKGGGGGDADKPKDDAAPTPEGGDAAKPEPGGEAGEPEAATEPAAE